MTYMLGRTRVSDYSVWRAVFDSHASAHTEAGLTLVDVWRTVDEPNNVFFMFEVADLDRANQFLHSPASAQAGRDSGVIDGEYHYLESVGGYPA